MKKETARHFTRLVVFDIVRSNLAAFAFGLLFLTCMALWIASRFVISSQTVEGRFVRWTVGQDYDGQGNPHIFVDLPDGRTIGAAVPTDWRPPAVGDAIRLEELTLLWSGRRYRLAPNPMIKSASDDPA